jgi:hypothetical protein
MEVLVKSEDVFLFALNYNLNYLTSFHNTMRSLLRDKQDTKEAKDNPLVKTRIELFDKMNSANVMLLALSFLEEMLVLLWKKQLLDTPIPYEGSISRYKPLMKNLGLDLENMPPCWAVLLDAYKVRNCILHANGRIDLMKNPMEMRSCIERHGDVLDKRLEIVVITPLFLERCIKAIRELGDNMLSGSILISSG